MTNLFTTNPGEITDFAPIPTRDIVSDLFRGLDDNKARLDERSRSLETEGALQVDEARSFVDSVLSRTRNVPQEENIDYNAPVVNTPNQPQAVTKDAAVQGGKELLKLSNYGYDSDSSPDYNSNVLKIGHANNKLEDGVSAALTKSLARRYNLKTGDFFEITTADGKTMKRRYDDTVPDAYRGKKLPETVDLYERGGSNKFGGKVVGIKPL